MEIKLRCKKMPWKTPTPITLSKKQHQILKENAVGTHTPLHIKTRSQIILHASKGWSNNAIEENMGIDPKTVNKWRDRYSVQYEELKRIETETPHKIRSTIMKVLSDAPRTGGPPKFKDEQVAAIIAISCEDPSKYGLPFSHWNSGSLKNEVEKLGIVESISVRQVGRFLKRKRFTTSPESVLAET
jgi:putative transposase